MAKKVHSGFSIYYYQKPKKPFGQPNIRADLRQDKEGLCFRWHTSLFHGSSVQSLSCVRHFVTPWTAACQPSLSITSSQSLLKLMSIESVMPSNHLILCHPLLLPPSIFPSIRVFSNESVFCIRWPKQSSIKKKKKGGGQGEKKECHGREFTLS